MIKRNTKQTGRSMIEMLGVLAIIGVLSIGGLYAYRQAMESYKIAQTIDWIRQIQMIYLDVCMDKNNCPFMNAYDESGNVVPGYADFNRAKLCQFNSQMCSARLPYFKEAAWYFYTLHGLTANIALTGLPQSVCRRIVSTPWTSITGMQTQAVFADGTRQNIAKSSENGVMRPQDQKALMEICEKPAQRYSIWIGFTSSNQ